MEIILALIGVSGVVITGILVFINTRRSNDLKKIELEQSKLKDDQEREAAKRKEASEKHQKDMERVAALESKAQEQDAAMDRMRMKFTLLWTHALELNQWIYEGKGPPPPTFPPGLLE